MSNLAIENLSKIVESGNAEALLSPGGIASEKRIVQEMAKNGMATPGTDVEATSNTFSGILKDSMEKVNLYQHQSDTAIKELVAGRTKNIHETMLTIERADTSLKLMMQVRNKVLDAYREIMRMQV